MDNGTLKVALAFIAVTALISSASIYSYQMAGEAAHVSQALGSLSVIVPPVMFEQPLSLSLRVMNALNATVVLSFTVVSNPKGYEDYAAVFLNSSDRVYGLSNPVVYFTLVVHANPANLTVTYTIKMWGEPV